MEILLTVYNGSSYVESQVLSLLNQSLTNYLVKISDDCSDDGSTQIINKIINSYSQHILFYIQLINVGVLENINALFSSANSEYIFFSDQDDVWLSHKMEISLKKMQEMETTHGNHTPILVHTDLQVVDQDLNLIHHSFRQYQNLDPNPPKLLPRLLLQNFVTGCTMLINKPLKDLVTPIPPEAIMHDWWIALTAATLGKIAYISEPTVLYRQHQKNNVGARKWGLNYIFSRLSNLEEIRSDIQKTIIQAKKFRETFQHHLLPEQLNIIETYINLPNQAWATRKYQMIKYGFYQPTRLKNIGFFLLI
ncbi:glycosyltransferase family 2 protein [Synechococcus sp. PCC 6312]|uniref:glycosyltransferase family 2 protein n=1 Tax=Synechococcus sp. (strain ATCC 27167 / PCC 6312) TaxID=195253 RepID=UPI00155B15B6|nr:glycosyltransferase family 2 protein [Synechococcus sp. PCC 6312]